MRGEFMWQTMYNGMSWLTKFKAFIFLVQKIVGIFLDFDGFQWDIETSWEEMNKIQNFSFFKVDKALIKGRVFNNGWFGYTVMDIISHVLFATSLEGSSFVVYESCKKRDFIYSKANQGVAGISYTPRLIKSWGISYTPRSIKE